VIRKAAQCNSVCRRSSTVARAHCAFTIVEVLIVVFALVILAAVVIPQFSRASQQSRQSSLKDVLQYFKTQIAVFKAQHQDVPPGYPGADPTSGPSIRAMASQLTEYSDVFCDLSPRPGTAFQFGPYVKEMPVNPVNGMNTVEMVGNNQSIPAPDGRTGWIYKPQTQELTPNLTGNDASGTPYSNY
jgi:type II secretory pathway pseudopilin PulG